jgi:ectoine hydroxylase-related dioxygenase (phytanoyl-CoA dioxygenase family)
LEGGLEGGNVPASIDPLEMNVVISPQEHRDGVLTAENVRLGTLLLHARGYVILKGAIPEALVAEVQSSFRALYEECVQHHRAGQRQTPPGDQQSAGTTVFWERGARFRIFPKLTGPFANKYVLRNPLADAIIAETLGADYYCKSVSSDTCVKGSTTQAPHRDIGFYDKDDVCGCVVNIALMHCGLHNGPIEIWPGGSHLWRSEMFGRFNVQPFVQDEPNPVMEVLASHIPSKLVELQPGDLMIRDPGMLHRGTPNPTDQPRTMLTAGYFRNDYYYPYGDVLHNLDEELYEDLEPSVQQLFRPFFDHTDWRYAKLRHDHAAGSAQMRRYSQ